MRYSGNTAIHGGLGCSTLVLILSVGDKVLVHYPSLGLQGSVQFRSRYRGSFEVTERKITMTDLGVKRALGQITILVCVFRCQKFGGQGLLKITQLNHRKLDREISVRGSGNASLHHDLLVAIQEPNIVTEEVLIDFGVGGKR